MPRVAYEGEGVGGTGGQGSGAGAGPGGGGASPGAGGQPPGGGAPAPYRPAGLPDHLFGTNDRETLDRVFKAYDGARTKLGEWGTVPEKPELYGFDASDKLKPFVTNFDKDPVYGAVRGIAHKAGITDKQFRAFMPGVLEHFVDGGLVDQPVDAKAQLRSLAPASAANLSDAEKEQAAARRMSANTAWVDGAKQQGELPKDVADFFAAAMASDPRAHLAIEWLRGTEAEPRPALDGGRGGGAPSDADLQARVKDPRGDPNSPKFERAFAEETDRLYQQKYG